MNTDLMLEVTFEAFLTDFKEKSVRNVDWLLYHLLLEMANNRPETLAGFLKSVFIYITEPENVENRIHGPLAYQLVLEDVMKNSSIFKQMFVDYYTLQTL